MLSPATVFYGIACCVALLYNNISWHLQETTRSYYQKNAQVIVPLIKDASQIYFISFRYVKY